MISIYKEEEIKTKIVSIKDKKSVNIYKCERLCVVLYYTCVCVIGGIIIIIGKI